MAFQRAGEAALQNYERSRKVNTAQQYLCCLVFLVVLLGLVFVVLVVPGALTFSFAFHDAQVATISVFLCFMVLAL